MAKKKPSSDSDDDNDKAQSAKVKRNRGATGRQVLMNVAVASAFVSVGIWIAHDFFNVDVPAHLAPPLATIVFWIGSVVRIIGVAILALLYGIFD